MKTPNHQTKRILQLLKITSIMIFVTLLTNSVSAQKKSLRTAKVVAAIDAKKKRENKTQSETIRLPKAFKGLQGYRTWTVGANFGVLAPVVAIGGTKDYSTWNSNLGFGGSIRTQFNHYLGIQANVLLSGKLAGNTGGTSAEGSNFGSYQSFETTMNYDWNALLTYNLLTFDILRKSHGMGLFLNFGLGQVNYKSTVTDGSSTPQKYPSDGSSKSLWYFPIGFDVRFEVSDRWNVVAGYSMRFVDGKDLDGTIVSSNPNQDRYSYSHFGIEYSVGKKKSRNIDWVNPAAVLYEELKDNKLAKRVDSLGKHVKTHSIMLDSIKVDSDNDGVSDYFDKEPDSEAGAKVDGSGITRDTDVDGIPDHRDKCPVDSGLIEFNGCPDPHKRVGMGASLINQTTTTRVTFAKDSALYREVQALRAEINALKKKKVITQVVEVQKEIKEVKNTKNSVVEEPKVAPVVEEKPIVEEPKPTVVTKTVKVKEVKAVVKEVKAKEEKILPTPKEEKKKMVGVEELLSTINFEFNSAIIRTSSYAALDQIVQELKSSMDMTLFLGGHASQEGSEDYNMQLSIDRATSVKSYFVNAGVASNRLTIKGYGITRPIELGDDEESRSRNRRVEIIKK